MPSIENTKYLFKESGVTTVTLRFLTNGKYVWTIETTIETNKSDEAIETVKKIDGKLKDTFPNYPMPSSSFTKKLEEDDYGP